MKRLVFFIALIHVTVSCIAQKPRLIDYAFDVYSQFGEDGIIEKIFQILKPQSKLVVEFGAWDGFRYSNTAYLWTNDATWKAILIEGDEARFQDLVRNTQSYPNCIAIQEWVGIAPHNCLETILQKQGINTEIDLLSIDIDGNDYHILNSLHTIRPRLIICEYNPTIPVTVDVYAPYAVDNTFGQSAAALVRLAHEKGYCLIALTLTNAFFVRQEDFHKFQRFETDIRLLDVNDSRVTLVTTYTGEYVFLSARGHYKSLPYGCVKPYSGAVHGSLQVYGSR